MRQWIEIHAVQVTRRVVALPNGGPAVGKFMQHNAEQNPEHPAGQKHGAAFVKIMDPPTALHGARVEDVAHFCWRVDLNFGVLGPARFCPRNIVVAHGMC